MAIEVLEWSKEDIRFVMAGKLAFSGAIDFTKSKRGRAFKFTSSHALLATKGKPNSNYRPDLAQENSILFPRDTGIEDATLLLMKEKNGRYSLARVRNSLPEHDQEVYGLELLQATYGCGENAVKKFG